MKFELWTAGCFYNTEGKERLEKLGFQFTPDGEGRWRRDGSREPTIEINTLDDLMKLREQFGDLIILGHKDTIVIYDDYWE